MKNNLHNQKGLTLIEIIIVLVILSILFSFLTGGLFSQGEKAKAKLNNLKMSKLKSTIAEYQLEYNSLPSSLNDLTGCPSKASNCIPMADKEDVLDAWDNPFVYQSSGNSYTIKTLGADKKPGGSGVDSDQEITGP
ncbi:MAG: type II secretion system protein GspG [Bdellovibrionota bacterium]